MSIYLDYAAATPMDERVLEAMKPYYSEKFFNPSATYLLGRQAKTELNDLRARAAAILGCRPVEIIFTSGATEANNLAIAGLKNNFPDGKMLLSAVEHDSLYKPGLKQNATLIPVDKNGRVDTAAINKLIDEQTVLISVMLVNNEIGTIEPVSEIARLLSEIRRSRLEHGNKTPLYLHSDVAQATNFLDIHVSRLGVDMLSLNGSKIYGPKGCGLLYVKAGTQLSPVSLGGGQEFGLRSGTENLASISGLVVALEMAQKIRVDEASRISNLRQEFEKQLLNIDGDVSINGGNKRAPHLVSVTFEGSDNETLMMKLDEAGVQCAIGSACSASSDEPSHVLKAIGLRDEQARATLRFSLGKTTTEDELDRTVKFLKEIL